MNAESKWQEYGRRVPDGRQDAHYLHLLMAVAIAIPLVSAAEDDDATILGRLGYIAHTESVSPQRSP